MARIARLPEGVFVDPFERGEIGRDLSRAACQMGLEGLVSKSRIRLVGRSTGSTSRTGSTMLSLGCRKPTAAEDSSRSAVVSWVSALNIQPGARHGPAHP
jgi:hypothetical protein